MEEGNDCDNDTSSIQYYLENDLNLNLAELKEAFDLCDLRHDGFIRPKELNNVLKSVGQNPTQDELDIIFKEVSINKKAIDFPEFLLVLMRCLKKKSFSWAHDDCLNVFKRLFKRDKTLDIKLMIKELKRVGVDVSYDELFNLVNESHIHKDYINDQGEFKLKELYEMMDKMENLLEK